MGLEKLGRALKNPKKAIKKTYAKVDESAGKKLFGNTVGFSRNFSGQISQIRNKKDIEKNPLSEKLLNQQYLAFGKPYEPTLIHEIRKKYEKMLEDDQYSFVVSEYKGKIYQRFIKLAIQNIPDLKKLVTDEIKQVIEGYYGGHFKVQRIACLRNYHIPKEIEKENELFSNKWHCDKRNTDLLKMFVNLSDVTEKDGPLHVISKNRTRDLMQMGFRNRANYNLPIEELENPEYLVRAVGEAGTTLFSNTQFCLHKAGNPDEGRKRDMIQFIFVPSKEPLKENWDEDVEPDEILQNMLKKE